MSPRGRCTHRGQDQAGEVVGAHGVRGEQPLDLAGIGVGDGVAPRGDAGVGHEEVDVPEVVEDLRNHRRVGLGIVDRSGVRRSRHPQTR